MDVATSADDENEVVLVGSWSSRELYERWLGGPVPGPLLAELRGLLAEEPTSHVYHVVKSIS